MTEDLKQQVISCLAGMELRGEVVKLCDADGNPLTNAAGDFIWKETELGRARAPDELRADFGVFAGIFIWLHARLGTQTWWKFLLCRYDDLLDWWRLSDRAGGH
jgi:hypothetical protein